MSYLDSRFDQFLIRNPQYESLIPSQTLYDSTLGVGGSLNIENSQDYLYGASIVSGNIDESEITGGNITIGFEDTALHADVQGNFWLGNEHYLLAPFSVSAAGAVKATSGQIGGWTLTDALLYSSDVTIDSDGNVTVGTGNDIAVLDAQDATYRLWIGNAIAASAPFRVEKDGSFTALSGDVGGWTIGTTTLSSSSGNIVLDSANEIISIGGTSFGSAGIQLDYNGGSPQFYVGDGSTEYFQYDSGQISWSGSNSSLTAGGAFTTTQASIGSWTVAASTITGGNVELDSTGVITVGTTNDVAVLDATDATYRIYVGNATAGSAPFRVEKDGTMISNDAVIGGWVIDSDSIQDAAGLVGLSSLATVDSDIRIWAGDTVPADANFWVKEDGSMYADSGTIGGAELAATYIQSTGFTAGALGEGWQIASDGTATFQNIYARGKITTTVFERDTLSSIGGTLLISKSDVLDTDMTAADSSTLTISGDITWELNEVIRIKDGTDDEYMLVTDISSAPTYTVTRDLAGSYAANSNPAWTAGTAVVSWGLAGWSYSQDFEGLSTGSLHGQDSWDTSSSSANVTVDVQDSGGSSVFASTPSIPSSTQYVEAANPVGGLTDEFVATRTLGSFNRGTFSVQFGFDGLPTNFSFYIYGANSTAFHVECATASADPFVVYYAGGTTHLQNVGTTDITSTGGIWYTLEVDFDAGRGTHGQFRMKLDSDSDIGAWTSWLDIDASSDFVNTTSLEVRAGITDTTSYVVLDNFVSYPNVRGGFFQVEAADAEAPYMRLLARTTNTYDDVETQMIWGNLEAVTGVQEYGFLTKNGTIKISDRGIDIIEGTDNPFSDASSITWLDSSSARTGIIHTANGDMDVGSIGALGSVTTIGAFQSSSLSTSGLFAGIVNTTDGSGNATVEVRGIKSGAGTGTITLNSDVLEVTEFVGSAGIVKADANGVLSTATTIALGSEVTGTLPVANGGTGATTLTANRVLLGNGTSAIATSGALSDGQLLIGSTGNAPSVAGLTAGEGIDITTGAGSITILGEDASDTNKGIVELATDVETLTGTDTGRSVVPSNLTYIGAFDGWIPAGETWTYASATTYTNTNTTYGATFTITGDLTSKYTAGMKVRFSQSTGGTKYGFIMKVAYSSPNTTITVFLGSDYSMANETISSPYYSMVKAPAGFSINQTKWMLDYTDTNDTRTAVAVNTWTNNGGHELDLPLGVWDVRYNGLGYASEPSASSVQIRATLSDANNTESDGDITSHIQVSATAGASDLTASSNLSNRKVIVLAADDTLYLNIRTTRAAGSGDINSAGWVGTAIPTNIRAYCAYL